MKKVKITILASDILKLMYVYPRQCAMTKAFHRANLPYHEGGGYIYHDDTNKRFPTPSDLQDKVVGMYGYADLAAHPDRKASIWTIDDRVIPLIEPADFDYELTIPDDI